MYVGSTEDPFETRWYRHKYQFETNTHPNRHLKGAVKQYGIENFEFEILQECEAEFCISFEQYWINMLGVADENIGYNLRPNAENNGGHRHTEESKLKIKIGNTGKKRTQTTKDLMSILMKERIAENGHPFLGRKHKPSTKTKMSLAKKGTIRSEESKRKQGEAIKGVNSCKARAILQFSLGGEFIREWSHMKEAWETLKLSQSNVSMCCTGKRKSCGGFKWKYKE